MDLNVHRTMLLLATRRAQQRLEQEGKPPRVDLRRAFWALHQGNWLTDMNQATAFFDAFEGRRDPYRILDIRRGKYLLPETITRYQPQWIKLFQSLWAHECQHAEIDLLPPGAGGDAPLNPQVIGGYYPYDHFDVVDPLGPEGRFVSREPAEFKAAETTRMTLTASEGVFTYARRFLLESPFQSSSRQDIYALRCVGHGAHTLQDFFGHSNFVELLLTIAARRGILDPALARVLTKERYGTFASYWWAASPEATPVMTGRFDRIDTIATLLGIYRQGIVPQWNDLSTGGFAGAQGEKRDLIFDVMFGTFSNNPFTDKALKAVKGLTEVGDAIQHLKGTVVKGVSGLFAEVARLFASQEARAAIDEVKDLAQVADMKESDRHAKAGRIAYLEGVIVQKLRHDLEMAKGPVLPHHTLLAKDKDVSHPEVRLAYKLACHLATEVTAELLYHYALGSPASALDEVLTRYYRHPELYLSDDGAPQRLRAITDRLYGERWWIAAQDDQIKVLP
jgi:Heterokaryon incompatibility protein Het-C